MSFAKIGTLVVALWCGSIAPAVASPSDVAINGTYTAFSDGDWAKKNQVYYNELPVMSTWTVTSTCRTFMDCTGQVTTSQGWTGELKYRAGQWVVFHTVEGWVKCVGAPAVAGEQHFTFWVDPANPSQFIGLDKTVGPSGACGINRWLTIEMPFKLTPI
ncbi:hypothetical protein [Mycolicibacterium pyrenivorans]|uniref:hypothetical protein n=1 Tax=Mycolicibacterium pyrenivorans TaxID=187102 RepID=UPI0021F38617|nr:hypothetical protein [Mycolicibacterium pyrenivorans]MCV7152890.1 hypothetical protein [Mycolicibacterium pyrenivorans]